MLVKLYDASGNFQAKQYFYFGCPFCDERVNAAPDNKWDDRIPCPSCGTEIVFCLENAIEHTEAQTATHPFDRYKNETAKRYTVKHALGKDFARRLGLEVSSRRGNSTLWKTGSPRPVSSGGLVDLITQMAEIAIKSETA